MNPPNNIIKDLLLEKEKIKNMLFPILTSFPKDHRYPCFEDTPILFYHERTFPIPLPVKQIFSKAYYFSSNPSITLEVSL